MLLRLEADSRLHYDITSVYFEGLYTKSEFVKFGYSRAHRPDTKQINIGLDVTAQGLPLAFRVASATSGDGTCFARTVCKLHDRLG